MMSIAINALLPHRPPMQWIDALIDCDETAARATASFVADHFAANDGQVLETALVECAAQTVAAAKSYRAQTSGQADLIGTGMLTGVSNFRVHSRPSAGSTLQIEVRELKRLGPMLMVSSTISCDGRPVASGELTLYA